MGAESLKTCERLQEFISAHIFTPVLCKSLWAAPHFFIFLLKHRMDTHLWFCVDVLVNILWRWRHRSGTFEVNKPPVGRSSDGCFSTKLTWSLLQVLCWQKHFLILYVTDSQILQLSDNFQVLWPSVAPGSLLFSYFIWVVGIKLISVKRLKYLVRFLVARYIASVSHALVACKLKVRPQPALFLQLLSKKPTWQFLFINRTEKALFRCVNVFFKQTIVLKLFVPLEIQIWSPC